MEEEHREAINNCMDVLVEKTNFSNVFQYLKSVGNVLTESQIGLYESAEFQQKSDQEKCRIFYRDIQTRGPKAFKALLKALDLTGHKSEHEMLLNSGKASFPKQEFPPPVRKATALPPSGTDVYKMTSNPRGYFLIINNINFKSLRTREGAMLDASIESLFQNMGYLGHYRTDLTAEEMERHLQEFCQNEELASVDSCIVVIMSHGHVSENDMKVYVCGTDGNAFNEEGSISYNSVLQMFSGEQCKLPRGQPRIFIFQSCRGDGEVLYNHVLKRDTVSDSRINCKDTFVLLSNVDGFVSNRSPNYGTWFITYIVQVFAEHACSMSLEKMMNLINDRLNIIHKEASRVSDKPPTQQTAVLRKIGVSKELYFNPGLEL